MMIPIEAGNAFPEFQLTDQNGETVTPKTYSGKWYVMYFYPKDDTPGCTKEACAFRDNFEEFIKADLQILGVSRDPAKKHQKFIENFSLPFPLLTDESTEFMQAVGVWGPKKFMGKTFDGIHRMSYLVDGQGIVRKFYPKVKPDEHAAEILEDYKELNT